MPCGVTRTQNLSVYLVETLFHGSLTHMIEIKVDKTLAHNLAVEKHSSICMSVGVWDGETEGEI